MELNQFLTFPSGNWWRVPCRDEANHLPKLKTLESFQESKNDVSNHYSTPSRTTKSKAATNTEAPRQRGRTGTELQVKSRDSLTKNCRWWLDRRTGRENLNWFGSSPRLSGPLLPPYLYIPDLLTWPDWKLLYFPDTAVIYWFLVATQNVFDMSPANNFSGSFNYLENLNILTVN